MKKKKEKTNDEILDEMVKKIERAQERGYVEDILLEMLWDDVDLIADMSEMLKRISRYLQDYGSERVNKLDQILD